MADTENNILSELNESFKSIILDRFSSPLILSFAISWSILNYKFFLIIFSSANIHYKLKLLHWHFNSPPHTYLLESIVYPLISAGIYIFIYPYANRLILEFVMQRKLDEIADKVRLEKTATFTWDHVQKINSRNNTEMERLKAQLQSSELAQSALEAEVSGLKSALQDRLPRSLEPIISFETVKNLSNIDKDIIYVLGTLQFDLENPGSYPTYDDLEQQLKSYSRSAILDTLENLITLHIIEDVTFPDGIAYLLSKGGIAIYEDLKSIYPQKVGDRPATETDTKTLRLFESAIILLGTHENTGKDWTSFNMLKAQVNLDAIRTKKLLTDMARQKLIMSRSNETEFRLTDSGRIKFIELTDEP